jgi:hypothetical protein
MSKTSKFSYVCLFKNDFWFENQKPFQNKKIKLDNRRHGIPQNDKHGDDKGFEQIDMM